MQINAPFDAIMYSQSEVGDLLRIGISSSRFVIGIVIHKEGDDRVFGVLKDNSDAPPYHVEYKRDLQCMRYAKGWVLDLPHETAVFGQAELAWKPGVVNVGPSGPLMNFAAPESRFDELTVNLRTFQWDDVQDHRASFPSWKIWASERDKNSKSAVPVVAFSTTV